MSGFTPRYCQRCGQPLVTKRRTFGYDVQTGLAAGDDVLCCPDVNPDLIGGSLHDLWEWCRGWWPLGRHGWYRRSDW